MFSDISLGIIVTFVATAAVSGFGLALGLWIGERGRRRDLMWWVGERQRPAGEDLRAEVEPSKEGDSEANARRRAEISAVMQGLEDELRQSGRPIDREELEAEALSIVAQLDTEVAEGMG